MGSRFDIGLVCTVGIGPERGGRAANQDNYLVCREREARWREGEAEQVVRVHGHGLLLAVADGMGGHEHGEVASGAAVQAVARLYQRGFPAHPQTTLRAWLLKSHRRLHERASRSGVANMGTTLTACWVLGRHAYWAHVGDSRLYHQRGEELRRLTADHTRGEMARRDGRPPPREPQYLTQSYIFGSRGLGDNADIRIDPGVDTGSLRLEPGDRLMLSSDGLHGAVPDHRIRDALREHMASAACASWLVERAIAAGSDDNITVLVARIEELEAEPPPEDEVALWDEGTVEVEEADLARWNDEEDPFWLVEDTDDVLVPEDFDGD